MKNATKNYFLFMILLGFIFPRVQGMISWVLESSKWTLQNLYSKYLYEIKEFRLLFLIAWYVSKVSLLTLMISIGIKTSTFIHNYHTRAMNSWILIINRNKFFIYFYQIKGVEKIQTVWSIIVGGWYTISL